MARLRITLLCIVLLTGCVAPSPFEAQNYQALPWAKKSFDEARAECRYKQMHKKHGSYAIDIPFFKACMEKWGYRYRGGSGLTDQAPLTLFPVSKTADSSVLPSHP